MPKILNCFDTYYTLKKLFIEIASRFAPKNKKSINELLDLKFRNMHIEKEYKINPYVNYIIMNRLYEHFEGEYLNKDLKKFFEKRKIGVFLISLQ